MYQPSMDLAHLCPKHRWQTSLQPVPQALHLPLPHSICPQTKLSGRPPNVQPPAPTIHEATVDRQNNLLIFPLQAEPEDLKTTATFPCSRLKPSSFPFSSLLCVLGLGTHLGPSRTFSKWSLSLLKCSAQSQTLLLNHVKYLDVLD